MKLSKVKKVCCHARQMDVVNTSAGNNLVTQWVGTNMVMYPLKDMRVSKEQLQKLWELNANVVIDMEQEPVVVCVDELEMAAGQVDEKSAPKIRLCNMDGFEVLAPKTGGLLYIPEWLLKPLEGKLDYVPMPGGWVAVYEGGTLGAMVRPVEEKWRGVADATVRAMAEALKSSTV